MKKKIELNEEKVKEQRSYQYHNKKKSLNKPLYSIIELAAEISLDPSSNILRLFIKPPGNEPGPDGDGK